MVVGGESGLSLAFFFGDEFASLAPFLGDAVAAVENSVVREAIERVKQGHAAQGFNNKFNKAYHSHSKTR